jgi:hypothetical protein
LEQGRQSGRTGIEVNAILGVNAVYVPIIRLAISPYKTYTRTRIRTRTGISTYIRIGIYNKLYLLAI